MTRIERKFHELKNKNKAALVSYITAGVPSLDATADIVLKLEESGVDIIELGIPFSDPMADGPTIQLASERSLSNGTTLQGVLDTVKKIREISDIPILLFGYYNPFLSFGLENLVNEIKDIGVDGVLVVDLPPEESHEFKQYLEKKDLNLIFLLAPTSTQERIDLVSDNASGFVYLVSVTGVTGERPQMDYSLKSLTKTIRDCSNLPVGIGFGVSSPDQAQKISIFADAVIVGSALVRIIEDNENDLDVLLDKIGTFASGMNEACYKQ